MNPVIRRVARWSTYLAVVLLLAAAGTVVGFTVASAGGANAIHTTLLETGASTLSGYFGEEANGYKHVDPGVLVVPATTDSGTGIKDAENGLAAIGAADLPAPATKGIISIPITVAGVAVVYNMPFPLNIDGKVLAAIYAGRIVSWDDPALKALNPGVKLPATAIKPLERSDSSGTTFQFTRYLQEQSPYGWPQAAKTQNWPGGTGEQGSNAMITGCSQTPGCIAYVGVGYDGVAVSQYHLHIAAVADKAGQFLLPTQANMAKAVAQFAPQFTSGIVSMINSDHGYPMVNYEWAVVKRHQANPVVSQFLNWVVTAGASGKYLGPLNFLPLPSNVLAVADTEIASVK